MDINNNNKKKQTLQKRTRSFDSSQELKNEMAIALYNLLRFSVDDIATAFDIKSRQTLRNRFNNANKLRSISKEVSEE